MWHASTRFVGVRPLEALARARAAPRRGDLLPARDIRVGLVLGGDLRDGRVARPVRSIDRSRERALVASGSAEDASPAGGTSAAVSRSRVWGVQAQFV